MKRSTIVVAVVAALVLSACGSDKKSSSTTVKGKGGAVVSVSIVAPVLGIVTTLMQAYNKANPSTRVVLPPAKLPPAQLAGFVARGRPGVYVLNAASIKKLAAGATKATFGKTEAVIAVSAANPKHVNGLNAFAATSGLHTTACGARTSFGNIPGVVLLKAKITPAKGTVTFDCTKVMKNLLSGQLDAALLYRSGLTVPKGIKLITVPAPQNVIVNYDYVVVGKNARDIVFGKYLASTAAQAVLKLRGYLP